MKEILVICRNCGNTERYDEDYMIDRRKKYHSCSYCGNHNKNYQENRKWANLMIKKGCEEVINLIKEDKFNTNIFNIHKGFDYKKI